MSEQQFVMTPELESKVLKVVEKGLSGIAKRSTKPTKSTKTTGKASSKTDNEKILGKLAESAAKAVDSPKKDKNGKVVTSEFKHLKTAFNRVDEHLTATKLTSGDYKKVALVAMELYLAKLATEPKPTKKAAENSNKSDDSEDQASES